MKILVDIEDTFYKQLLDDMKYRPHSMNKCGYILANGTPISEGKYEHMKKENLKNMTVKELIEQLQKLPPDMIISFCDYDDYYYGEVCWDLTQEEYEKGYSDQPYIFLTKMEEP